MDPPADSAALPTATAAATPAATPAAPLSISRLTAAFAKMLGSPAGEPTEETGEPTGKRAPTQPAGVTPQGIIEAMLFVGQADNEALAAEEIAATMRDVTAQEVAQAIDDLNAQYTVDETPYRIEATPAGYRMTLLADFDRLRDRYHDRTRAAQLSQVALEVLSIVAYRQPIAGTVVDELRDKRSVQALAQLVRRGLLRRDAAEGQPSYSTTDRFLKVFGLEGIQQLPSVAEFDD